MGGSVIGQASPVAQGAEANLEAHSFAQAKFIAFMAKMGGSFGRRCR
jgi:hypothetical protein